VLLVIVAGGATQACLAFRIEFDRRIFEAWAHDTSVDAAHGFDTAMRELALLPQDRVGRSVVERVRGLLRLVRSSGWLLAVQLAFFIIAAWMCR